MNYEFTYEKIANKKDNVIEVKEINTVYYTEDHIKNLVGKLEELKKEYEKGLENYEKNKDKIAKEVTKKNKQLLNDKQKRDKNVIQLVEDITEKKLEEYKTFMVQKLKEINEDIDFWNNILTKNQHKIKKTYKELGMKLYELNQEERK